MMPKEWARHHETEAARFFVEAVEIREALFDIFGAIAVGVRVGERAFQIFSAALAKAPNRGHLAATPAGFAWRMPQKWTSACDILTPALWSAGDLILNATSGRIRRCANTECLWLFVDQSKTNTRRWCDMGSCGNRAKGRRHYERSKRR
jgi:predicted RNA-binding Zn ribbon-like protein